jgi:hypothetical protein
LSGRLTPITQTKTFRVPTFKKTLIKRFGRERTPSWGAVLVFLGILILQQEGKTIGTEANQSYGRDPDRYFGACCKLRVSHEAGVKTNLKPVYPFFRLLITD